MSTSHWNGTPCQLWQGRPNHHGYGSFTRDRRSVLAHRDAYERAHGPIPPGLQVQHLCDENYPPGDFTYRRCIEPTHLALGTHKDNTAHMYKVGRGPVGHRNGRHTKPESTVRGEAHRWFGRDNRGEKHVQAKLTDEDVRAIRALWATRRFTQQQIANLFEMPRGSVARLVAGWGWTHVF
jgi:hypothetical protein